MMTDDGTGGMSLLRAAWCMSKRGAQFLKRRHRFEVPSTSLSEALALIAKQADVPIVVPFSGLDHRVPEIKGILSLDDMLDRVLAASGLSFRRGVLLTTPRSAVAPQTSMQELVSIGGEFQQEDNIVVELLDPVKRRREGFPSVYPGNESVSPLELPLPCVVLRSPDDPNDLQLPWGPGGVLIQRTRTSMIAQDLKSAVLGDAFAYSDIDDRAVWFQSMIASQDVKLLREMRKICPDMPLAQLQDLLQDAQEKAINVPNFMHVRSPREYMVTVARNVALDWLRGERRQMDPRLQYRLAQNYAAAGVDRVLEAPEEIANIVNPAWITAKPGTLDAAHQEDQLVRVSTALEGLPRRQRQLYVEVVLLQKSIERVRRALHITIEEAKAHLEAAAKTMAQQWPLRNK